MPEASRESRRSPQRWMALLEHNGFEHPERWVPFARRHSFHTVCARRLRHCPDCGSSERRRLGTYVHFSTLIRLERCRRCDLVYADTHIDPRLVREHFETAYKEEAYFRVQRRAVFERLARLVASFAPRGARILDVGGARGDLLAALRELRPDLELTLSDVSERACVLAERLHGLRAICRPSNELGRLGERFDVVLLVDVAYYEPDIRGLWRTIDGLVKEGGALVTRIPNRVGWIQVGAGPRSLLARLRGREGARITLYNPEHVFAFTRRYLRARLGGLGFGDIEFLPSPPLLRSGWGRLRPAEHRISRAVHRATRGALTPSPSLLVVAHRRAPGSGPDRDTGRAPGPDRSPGDPEHSGVVKGLDVDR